MKNVYLYIGLLMLLCTQGFSQGTDVVFLIDNSSSITGAINTTGAAGTEYNNMYNSIQLIMDEVLECNPDNKITIVQYSAASAASGSQRIWIESDFTGTAYGFTRRYNNVGNIPGSVNLLSYALNGAVPPLGSGTISGTTALNQTPGNALAVFLFTDAPRNNDLLSNGTAGPNNNAGFSEFTDLKLTEGAKFVVVNTQTVAATIAASAGVASLGGSWTGAIESYSDDPSGDSVPPRMFVNTSFSLIALEIETVTDFICSITEEPCPDHLVITTPAFAQDNRQAKLTITASNTINNGAVGVYHGGETVTLTSGFHAANGSRFRGYIEGCTGVFVGRVGQFDDDEPVLSNKEVNFFNIAPNPANSMVTITSTEDMKSVTITSQDGKTLYSRALPDKTTNIDIPVGSYSNGIYVVSVTTANGKMQTEKLIKN